MPTIAQIFDRAVLVHRRVGARVCEGCKTAPREDCGSCYEPSAADVVGEMWGEVVCKLLQMREANNFDAMNAILDWAEVYRRAVVEHVFASNPDAESGARDFIQKVQEVHLELEQATPHRVTGDALTAAELAELGIEAL